MRPNIEMKWRTEQKTTTKKKDERSQQSREHILKRTASSSSRNQYSHMKMVLNRKCCYVSNIEMCFGIFTAIFQVNNKQPTRRERERRRGKDRDSNKGHMQWHEEKERRVTARNTYEKEIRVWWGVGSLKWRVTCTCEPSTFDSPSLFRSVLFLISGRYNRTPM